MGLTIKHATLSNVPDEGVPGEIGPSEWNGSHTIVDSDPLVFLATGQSELESVWSFSWSILHLPWLKTIHPPSSSWSTHKTLRSRW